jgi:RNA polymerase sigma-70 factor, ECF subfamily
MIDPDETDDPLAPYRSELRAHCYRMLGSFQDAEDVLQEVSLRAWRGRSSFEGRSSVRTWLHRIAVNACLNELARKERRVLPMDMADPAGAYAPLEEPRGDIPWLEPFPDDPGQTLVDRESVELAFVAAVQYLPANQRAALIMFDVLGFSALEIAHTMDTTAASVNSALQRARTFLAQKLPERSQRATLDVLGQDGQRDLVEGFTVALAHHDIDGMLSLLTEDATWSMPPIPTWFRGHEAIAAFCAEAPFNYRWRCRPVPANGQLALGCYWWVETAGAYVAYSLNVFDLREDRISSIVSFIGGERLARFGLPPEVSS